MSLFLHPAQLVASCLRRGRSRACEGMSHCGLACVSLVTGNTEDQSHVPVGRLGQSHVPVGRVGQSHVPVGCMDVLFGKMSS